MKIFFVSNYIKNIAFFEKKTFYEQVLVKRLFFQKYKAKYSRPIKFNKILIDKKMKFYIFISKKYFYRHFHL